MTRAIYTKLGNYYGRVYAEEREEKYWLCLDDYSSTNELEISKELFNALEKEFGVCLEDDDGKS